MHTCENLSPLLFEIYLNNFESYVSRHYKDLDTLSDDITCHLSRHATISWGKSVFFQ